MSENSKSYTREEMSECIKAITNDDLPWFNEQLQEEVERRAEELENAAEKLRGAKRDHGGNEGDPAAYKDIHHTLIQRFQIATRGVFINPDDPSERWEKGNGKRWPSIPDFVKKVIWVNKPPSGRYSKRVVTKIAKIFNPDLVNGELGDS